MTEHVSPKLKDTGREADVFIFKTITLGEVPPIVIQKLLKEASHPGMNPDNPLSIRDFRTDKLEYVQQSDGTMTFIFREKTFISHGGNATTDSIYFLDVAKDLKGEDAIAGFGAVDRISPANGGISEHLLPLIPHVAALRNEMGFGGSGRATRRLLTMGAETHRAFPKAGPLHSGRIVGSMPEKAEKIWNELVDAGKARRTHARGDRYVLLDEEPDLNNK